jgi:fatty acid-binding protein DegV
MAKVEDMLTRFDKVIFVPVSYALSSQYANSTMLDSEFPGKFFPVKTNKAVYENELLYKKLVECINAGMDAPQAIEEAIKVLDNSITIFSTLDNTGLAKSGRTSKAMVKAMGLFKIKPIVEQYGKNHLVGVAMSLKGALKEMAKYAAKRFNVKTFDGSVNSVCILETFGQTQEQKNELLN